MKLLSATTIPFKLWTSFDVVGFSMFLVVMILSGFDIIPLVLTVNPENLPNLTMNEPLFGLNYFLYLQRIPKISFRYLTCSQPFWTLLAYHPHILPSTF